MSEQGILSEKDIEAIAKSLAEKMPREQVCHLFSEEEVMTLKSILKTKKTAAKLMIIMVGTLLLWALKDIYDWIALHLQWGGK